MKYSDGVWKEKLWGQIGEELKKGGKFQLRILKFLSIIPEFLIINK